MGGYANRSCSAGDGSILSRVADHVRRARSDRRRAGEARRSDCRSPIWSNLNALDRFTDTWEFDRAVTRNAPVERLVSPDRGSR